MSLSTAVGKARVNQLNIKKKEKNGNIFLSTRASMAASLIQNF